MAKFFKQISSNISRIADIINGTPPASQPIAATAPPEQPKGSPAAPAKAAAEDDVRPAAAVPKVVRREPPQTDIFNNAIDRRDRAIHLIVDEFRQATGTNHSALANLHIYVVVDKEDFDLTQYAWADDTMKQQLRLSLDNAMLETIGRKRLEINFTTKQNLPKGARMIVADTLYYSFISAPAVKKQVKARITVIEGTGSMAKKEYVLDSTAKDVYHIGRGPMSRKPGAIRPNDIVIRDCDPDNDLQKRNDHVSSAHADIVARNGGFFIKALRWGCRPMGGACSKLIYDGAEHEIMDTTMNYRLADGYLIELGKNVMLQFNDITD